MNVVLKLIVIMPVIIALSGCSSSYLKDKQQSRSEDANFRKQIKPDSSTSPAVLALIKKARIDALNGNIDKAMLRLERAVRIEPANASVWHYMSKLFLQQENYKQASGYASKSITLAGDNKNLRIDNWRIIGHSRYRLGNVKGAQQAQDIINKLQQ